MGITIKSLQKNNSQKKSTDYLFKDVVFDLSPSYSYNNQLNRQENLRDIRANFDIEAIKTSVGNCFLTSPGQKILNPTFGVDLRRFLFDPVDKYIANIITDDIRRKLPIMEPRIRVSNVSVVPNAENQEYEIYLQIDVPILNVEGLSIKSTLNTNGYTTL